MDTAKYSAGPGPVGRGLAKLGDAWSMPILRDAGSGLTRFDQFRTSLGIAPNILTRRLIVLVAAGLLEKTRYSKQPPWDEFLITAAGRDLLPVLKVIGAWGRRHNGGGEMSQVFDAETRVPVDPSIIDRRTGAPIGTRPLRLVRPDLALVPASAAEADAHRRLAVPERPVLAGHPAKPPASPSSKHLLSRQQGNTP